MGVYNQRSTGYTIVLGVCMLLCLLLVSKLLLGTPEASAPPTHRVVVRVTEEQIGTLLTEALSDRGTEVQVHIQKEGIEVQATLERRALETYDWGRTLLLFLPEQCALRANWTPQYDKQTGLMLQCQTMTIAGMDVPVQTANRITEVLTQAIQTLLPPASKDAYAIALEQGALLLIQNRTP